MSPIMNRLMAAAVSSSPPRKKIRKVRTSRIPSMQDRPACHRMSSLDGTTSLSGAAATDRSPPCQLALRSVARDNRAAGAAELVAHAAENRPHPHIDVVIGKIREPAVRMQGAEAIEVSFDAQHPVAGQQQLAAEA